MENLEIVISNQIPNGYEIDLEKSDLSKNKIVLKKKEIKLPTTSEECVPFIKSEYYYIDNSGNVIEIDQDYNRKDSNIILNLETAEAFAALTELVKFRDIWNQGWKPNYTSNTDIFVITFHTDKPCLSTFAGYSSVLSFPNNQLRNKFYEQFKDLIEIAKPLL